LDLKNEIAQKYPKWDFELKIVILKVNDLKIVIDQK